MASFWVPPALRPGLEVIRDLEDADAERVIRTLADLPTFRSISELVPAVGNVLPEDLQRQASELVDSLIALVTQMEHLEWTAEEIAEATSEAPGVAPTEASRRRTFATRIVEFLTTPSIRSTARAADLLIHHQQSFRSARVFTDVRPVFGDDVAQRPDGAVIVHMLELNYWSAGESKSMYVALDVGDLKRLQGVLERARNKEKALDAVLESATLTQFTPEQREP